MPIFIPRNGSLDVRRAQRFSGSLQTAVGECSQVYHYKDVHTTPQADTLTNKSLWLMESNASSN